MSIATNDHQDLKSRYVLSADQIASYHENGWLHLPGLLSPECAADLNERFDDVYEALRQTSSGNSLYFTSDRYHRQHRIFNDPAGVDELFNAVARSPRAASVAHQLIGSEPVLYLRSTVFEKPPARDESLPTTLHQDFPYFPFDRSGSVQIWVALTDLPIDSGTLRFVSGSHRRYGVIGRTNVLEEEQVLLARKFGELPLTPPRAMRAGDATVHHDLTIHGADASQWDRARRGFTVTMVPADVKYTGADYWVTDGLGLGINELVRHERFPLL